jgi:hypothetical protein
MSKLNPHRRLESTTVDLVIALGAGQHNLSVSLCYSPSGRLTEIAFVGRGKIGQGLDEMLRELGIQLSRAIQGRDPQTGAEEDQEETQCPGSN